MNERIRELAEQATTTTYEDDGWRLYATKVETFNKEKFAELIVREHLYIMKTEWYELNNMPVDTEGENTRDVGIRVGRKSEIIVLLDKIRTHFGCTE